MDDTKAPVTLADQLAAIEERVSRFGRAAYGGSAADMQLNRALLMRDIYAMAGAKLPERYTLTLFERRSDVDALLRAEAAQ